MGEKYILIPKRILQEFSSFFNILLIDFNNNIMNKNYKTVLKEKILKTMSKTVAPKCIWIYLNSIHVIKIHLRHPTIEIFLIPSSWNKYLSPVYFAIVHL